MDPAVSVALCRELLSTLETRAVVEVLHRCHREICRAPLRQVYSSFAGALAATDGLESLPYGRTEAMYVEATRLGYASVRLPLLEIPPYRAWEPRQDRRDTLTLGERKWHARLRDRGLLERLMADPDPTVVGNLLCNPGLREDDVVAMACRRPAAGPALAAIGGNMRWLLRPRVQDALVQNPYAPTRIGLLLLPLVSARVLSDVSRDGGVHGALREAASYLLELRRR